MFIQVIEKLIIKKIIVTIVIVGMLSYTLILHSSKQTKAQGNLITPTIIAIPTLTLTSTPMVALPSTTSKLTLNSNSTPAAISAESSYSFFEYIIDSPWSIPLLWSIAFIFFSAILNVLASNSDKADGEQKFTVYYKEKNNQKIYKGAPLSISDLENYFADQDREVVDIEVLAPNMVHYFNVAIDLGIGTIAADTSTIIGLSAANSNNLTGKDFPMVMQVIMGHFIVLLVVVFILKSWNDPRKGKVAIFSIVFANLMGLLNLATSFYVFNDLILK